MKTTVYVAYHKVAPRLEGACIVPIHVGRAVADTPLANMLGDETGESISERNDAWCELTALYWAWKNDRDSDYIGLMHYRRVLDVTDRVPLGPAEHFCDRFDIADWGDEVGGWLSNEASEFDIVVPRAHTMGRSVKSNYNHGHAPRDWDILRDVIVRDYPEYKVSFDAVSKGREIRLGNLAIMARPMFNRYCAFLFGALFAVEAADIDRSNYSVYQSRYIGFLAERLLTVFVHHVQKNEPAVRIKEVAILNTSKALMTPYLGPEDSPTTDTVNIALSADRAYLPHAAAMLRSMLDHADPDRPINVFLLHSGLNASDLAILDMMLRERAGTTLHGLDTGGWFEDSYRSSSRAPSNATYNRFLLFSLLPGLDRLLYLDADMIVQADVCALYDSDIGSNQIGAVPDWIMTRTLTGPVKTVDPLVPDLATYHRNILGLGDEQIAQYFNAGVLLFNFSAMKDPKAVGGRLLADARDGKYLFRDQDILNRRFKHSYQPLDARWNVFNSLDASYGKVPKENYARAMQARRNPWILHFADRDHKPWKNTAVPHAGAYWSALIRTPFYGEVLRQSHDPSMVARVSNRGWIVRVALAVSEKFPVLRGPFLRIYAWMQRGA